MSADHPLGNIFDARADAHRPAYLATSVLHAAVEEAKLGRHVVYQVGTFHKAQQMMEQVMRNLLITNSVGYTVYRTQYKIIFPSGGYLQIASLGYNAQGQRNILIIQDL